MRHFDVAIIGGGASGIVSAISAARAGKSSVLLEKGGRLGRKILASGNGRCNLSNEKLDESFYNPSARPLVKSILATFGANEICDFFGSLGLHFRSEEGRIFPVTNQSASVLRVLEIALEKLSVNTEVNFDACEIDESSGRFIITSRSGGCISAGYVVLAAGGKSYPALGSDGCAYKLAQKFGHTVIKPVPSAVAVVAKDQVIHHLQGQKISAIARCMINGRMACEAEGDLLFTRYGLSGTAILDISERISIAVNRAGVRNVEVSVDMVPFLAEPDLEKEISKRRNSGLLGDDLLTGILPNKFCRIITSFDAHRLKDWRFRVTGTRGWNEAEFTAGGIEVEEVREGTLESKLKNRLYFAGEILDVDGRRGGYNLAWAWASGFAAGLTGQDG